MTSEQTTQEQMPDTKGASPQISDNLPDSVTSGNERPSGGLSLNTPASSTAWADKYGSVLKPIALKYGEQLFNFTMSIGVANVATQTIMRRIRGNNELTKSMMILVSTLDAQAKSILAMSNSMEQFMACKTEIESSTPAIMVPEAAGRIVVPS